MKTYKKGISLIVLVVTVIVMAILATTVIISLSSTNIIEQANDAVNASNIANKKQVASVLLAEYQLGIANGTIASSVSANDYVIEKLEEQEIDTSDVAVTEDGELVVGSAVAVVKGEISLGDIVNYDAGVATYTGEWRVLGVDNGQIILLSTASVGDLTLKGLEGYNTGADQMDTMCLPYGNGEHATGARSVRLADVNRITGYNPEKELSGSPCGYGKDREYGITGTYSIGADGFVKFVGSNGVKTAADGGIAKTDNITTFSKLDGTTLGTNETYDVKNNYFEYQFYKGTTDDVVQSEGGVETRAITSDKYAALCGTGLGEDEYWLADKCSMTREMTASWGYYSLDGMGTGGWCRVGRWQYLYNSGVLNGKTADEWTKTVRAVVYIDAAAELVEETDGSWSLK